FAGPVQVALDKLSLDFAGDRFVKTGEGTYALEVKDDETKHGAKLQLTLKKPPLRHGDDGLVRGVHGEDMFYVFVPRCEVSGSITLDGKELQLSGGQGW